MLRNIVIFAGLVGVYAHQEITHEHLEMGELLQQSSADILASVKAEISELFRDQPMGETEEGGQVCKHCVRKAALATIEYSVKALKGWCEKTHHERIKQMCEKAERNPEIALGFLIEEVRPLSIGYAACIGARKCSWSHRLEDMEFEDDVHPAMMFDHPKARMHMETFAQEMGPMETSPQEMGPMIMESESVDMSPSKREWKKDGATHDMKVSPEMSFEMPEIVGSDGESCHRGGHCRCHSCIAHASMRLVNDHFAAAVVYCGHKHECPFIRGLCSHLEKHPNLSFGFLMGLMKPWKFGAGACVALHQCPYWHFHGHHGHHHGLHHHGQHHGPPPPFEHGPHHGPPPPFEHARHHGPSPFEDDHPPRRERMEQGDSKFLQRIA
eukprot:GHVN01087750.1.p1 GENE.GHVN01087750.1~~GHVN01087750.1.p1  ORF type:complete len:383 (-),score=35.70 GHVN01087750.1:685-1833(-)